MPNRTISKLRSFETTVAMTIPGVDNIVTAEVKSDVLEGMTITIPTGAPMYSLHDLFASGLVQEVSFLYTEAEKADD